MLLNPGEWHQRYIEQSKWSKDLRHFILNKMSVDSTLNILDVGCGTGALLPDYARYTSGCYGIDISIQNLQIAKKYAQYSRLTCGDAHSLPYQSRSFDICICHYFLLWVKNPLICLREMIRVTHPGGWIIALAEPEYSGRIDYPPELSVINTWQEESLRKQNADPHFGQKLAAHFVRSGLKNIQFGLIGGEWKTTFIESAWRDEWKIISHDLTFLTNKPTYDEKVTVQNLDLESRQNGERVVFVPTFYAFGQVPQTR